MPPSDHHKLSTLRVMHQHEGSAVFRRGAKTDGQGEEADASAGQSEDMSGSSTEKSTLKMR